MPISLISSLAFAIDPLSQFKVSATRISPAIRTRRRKLTHVLNDRSDTNHYTSVILPYKYLPGGSYASTTSTTVKTDQPSLEDISVDITALDRPIGSEMGEFSKWKVQTLSTPRSTMFRETIRRWYNDSPSGYWFDHNKVYRRKTNGAAAYITVSRVNTLRSDVQARATAEMQKQVLGLYSRCSSQKRATTLFRNIVELRDLPRSVLQLKDTIQHLRSHADALKIPRKMLERIHSSKTILRDIPKEYISYQFGWRQLYVDIRDLMLSPNRISKRVNFLIRRNGKASTYRSQINASEGYTTTSGFLYSTFTNEIVSPLVHRVLMDHELKMVINATFEFPDVDTPTFQDKEFSRQLGAAPSLVDLYNLVPWTWLFDWYTGLGKYLEVIEGINSDRELINWGVLTCNTQGALETAFIGKVQNAETLGTSPTRYWYTENRHVSRLQFSSQLRKDVSTLLDVSSTGDISSLSIYQQSILGSLIALRAK